MINWEEFNAVYGVYGNVLVIEIINSILEGDKNENPPVLSCEERMIKLKKNVDQKDFHQILLIAHWMKGNFDIFYDWESSQIARNLREMARNETDTGLEAEFEKLKLVADKLVIELREYRKTLTA